MALPLIDQTQVQLGDCETCGLAGCPQVPGHGFPDARIVFVGEAPGDEEIKVGKPFVGPSGKLLNRVLAECGIDRSDCYLTNACLCRPQPHRAPKAKEVSCCRQRLVTEITAIRPTVIVALGNVATRALLGSGARLSECRGAVELSNELRALVVPTYHPAAVLRNASLWFDLVRDVDRARAVAHDPPTPRVDLGNLPYAVVATDRDLRALVGRLKDPAVKDVVIDVENAPNGDLLCLGVHFGASHAYVVTGGVLASESAIELLSEALCQKRLIGQNLKHDLQILYHNGFPWFETGQDTMLMHYSMDERKGTHGLKNMAREFLGVPDYEKEIAPYKKNMSECPKDLLYYYNACDIVCTWALHDYFSKRLGPLEKRVLNDMLLPASDVLAQMEYDGIRVDRNHLAMLREELSKEIITLEDEAYKSAGTEFNLNSPKQVSQILYGDLGLPIPGGEITTREDVLKLLEPFHALPSIILQYRKKRKLLSTYIEALIAAADDEDRVHTTFNLHGTVTGRLSSSNPVNLQNIPRDPLYRNIFIATPGWTLVRGDLSQAEVRVLAEYSQDPALIANLAAGGDVHVQTACLMYGLQPEAVTDAKRTAAKRLTFAVIYGFSPMSLAQELKMSEADAKRLISEFFRAYPQVKAWMSKVQQDALVYGEVRTLLGRVRRFGLITPQNRDGILRQAVNTPIQSVASDITLKALIKLGDLLENDENTRLLLTVHDEILLETRKNPLEVAQMLRCVMLDAAREVTAVPFEVEVSYGQSWGNLKEVE